LLFPNPFAVIPKNKNKTRNNRSEEVGSKSSSGRSLWH
jgi:hypothetical protein